jgi:hypothetical protein
MGMKDSGVLAGIYTPISPDTPHQGLFRVILDRRRSLPRTFSKAISTHRHSGHTIAFLEVSTERGHGKSSSKFQHSHKEDSRT